MPSGLVTETGLDRQRQDSKGKFQLTGLPYRFKFFHDPLGLVLQSLD